MLLGRFLTRSGDQAWDFAVPLILLKVFPGELRIAAFYYLLVRLAHVIFLPRFALLIDQANRFLAAKVGIFSQLAGILLGFFSINFLFNLNSSSSNVLDYFPWFAFLALVVGGILSTLGSSFMDIAIASDLVPSTFEQKELAGFNGRLRQIDLLTELGAPVVTGFLLMIETPQLPLVGFWLVGIWNLVSFLPEYLLIKSIFRLRPDLMTKKIELGLDQKTTISKKLSSGWQSFFREPVALAVLAYSLLWLSVLSPHGVLLTAFLKDGWKLPEWIIGAFRGLGAVFGLVATVLYPRVILRFGLEKGSQAFLLFQALMVIGALASFFQNNIYGQIGFLVFILASRIGLYGFSLGEMQIRQVGIRPEVRGRVNGFAAALTGIATLGLYGAGAALPKTSDFAILVMASGAAVIFGAALFTVWVRKKAV